MWRRESAIRGIRGITGKGNEMRSWIARKLYLLAYKIAPRATVPIDVNEEVKKLDSEFKNWRQTVTSRGFKHWVDEQDIATQALATSLRASDAIKLLKKYKNQLQVIK